MRRDVGSTTLAGRVPLHTLRTRPWLHDQYAAGYECSSCHYQASLTAGTLFHSINLPLTKWFWAIYLIASDKGGISALRLAKQIGVSWITAHRMLRKSRVAGIPSNAHGLIRPKEPVNSQPPSSPVGLERTT